MINKLVLIDGHSILNRAFYGIPDLTNAEGLHTNAVYGFLNILFKITEEEQPDYLAVAFDLSAPTFRHEMYQEYKGTRKPMPQELREQVPVMKEVLQSMGILTMEKAGLEADDILGTMAKRGEAEGLEVALVSGDRDLLQIASEHIKIRIPKTRGGKTEIEDYYAKDVTEHYQVTPKQFIELKALMGDTADNIPGVPKVGEKTATSLMVSYGSLDGIYEHLEEISKKSIHDSLKENRDLADLSLKLATINIDAELPYKISDARLSEWFNEASYQWFVKLNFKNMLSRFSLTEEVKEEKPVVILQELGDVEQFFSQAGSMNKLSFSLLKDDEKKPCMFAFAEEKRCVILMPDGLVTIPYLLDKITSLFAEWKKQDRKVSVFDIKRLYQYLEMEQLFAGTSKEVNVFFDCKLAAYLVNPNHKEYELADLSGEYTREHFKDFSERFGKSKVGDLWDTRREELVHYLADSAQVLFEASDNLQKQLNESKMLKLFEKIEMPLTYVLYSMEKEGVLVKGEVLKEYSDTLGEKLALLEQKIYDLVGEKFNINSPKQLGEILFEKMGIQGGKKTKTGYSTAADVLEKLAPAYPVVADILEYRGMSKLKSTYADGLADFIEEDGRIHSSFNQMITATGRISSTEPNLQNIPMKTEMGRAFRKVFIAKEGCELMDADYSQIELRILAHMSGDHELIEAYRTNEDIHAITASKVFHVPFQEVTPLLRRNAKAVNFGIVYGISSFGLSEDLSISRKEASEYIKQYFETYPSIKEFLDRTVEEAKANGYTTTMFDRRRPMPELSSSNHMVRQFGERAAMNAPIQGTAADIMKIAMVRVFDRLRAEGLKSRLILQIHDELVIETSLDEEEKVRAVLTEEMEQAASLAVPLEIDLNVGKDWFDAH